jgi:hypothetical protein
VNAVDAKSHPFPSGVLYFPFDANSNSFHWKSIGVIVGNAYRSRDTLKLASGSHLYTIEQTRELPIVDRPTKSPARIRFQCTYDGLIS